MNKQPYMPDASVDKRLLTNLRRARLEMEAVSIQLESEYSDRSTFLK